MTRAVGEFDLIARHFATRVAPDERVLLGIGDDCALLRAPTPGQVLAVTSDMLVAGRHFVDDADPASIGHKTLAVNLSDLAAMGAEPLGFTLSLALPTIDDDWLRAFCDGMFALSRRARCPLVGGDTTRGPLCLSVTVFGQVPPSQALRRSGARRGDDLWISGPVGGAALAVAARAGGDPVPAGAARRLDWPQPRLELGLRLRGLASAAIDVSDGLAGDLSHVLQASGCSGARIELARLPIAPEIGASVADSVAGSPDHWLRFVLDGGDDYELLFTAPPSARDAIFALGDRPRPGERASIGARTSPGDADPLGDTPSLIGSLSADVGILIVEPDGARRRWDPNSYDHFK